MTDTTRSAQCHVVKMRAMHTVFSKMDMCTVLLIVEPSLSNLDGAMGRCLHPGIFPCRTSPA